MRTTTDAPRADAPTLAESMHAAESIAGIVSHQESDLAEIVSFLGGADLGGKADGPSAPRHAGAVYALHGDMNGISEGLSRTAALAARIRGLLGMRQYQEPETEPVMTTGRAVAGSGVMSAPRDR